MKLEIPYPQILNELSLSPTETLNEFACRLKSLLTVIDAMVKMGFGRNLIVSHSLLNSIAYSDLNVRQCIIKLTLLGGQYKELKVLALALFSKCQYLEDYMSGYPEQEILYKNQDVSRLAFGFSYTTGLPSISFQYAEFASQTNFDLVIGELNDKGDVAQRTVNVMSFSCPEKCALAFDVNSRKIINEISSGVNLLRYKSDFMSRISFSTKAEHQLAHLDRADFSTNGFLWICRALLSCNHCAEIWNDGNYDKNFFDLLRSHSLVVAESESESSSSGKYADMRTFQWDDGSVRTCLSHIKNRSLNLRIYFDYDNVKGIVYIGHIGEHLPIQSGNY